ASPSDPGPAQSLSRSRPGSANRNQSGDRYADRRPEGRMIGADGRTARVRMDHDELEDDGDDRSAERRPHLLQDASVDAGVRDALRPDVPIGQTHRRNE